MAGEKNDSANKGAANVDWVTRRSACSLAAVFKELRGQVEQDVKTRNGLRPELAPYEFFVADQDRGFRVSLKAKELEMAVLFVLGEHAISVSDDKGGPRFEVTLSFNERGECKLQVDGDEPGILASAADGVGGVNVSRVVGDL